MPRLASVARDGGGSRAFLRGMGIAATLDTADVVLFENRVVTAAAVGNVLIAVYRDTTEPEDFAHIASAHRSYAQGMGAKMAKVSLVVTHSVSASAESRRAASEFSAASVDYVSVEAIVLEAQGMAAAIQRSIVTGILMAARNRPPSKVFANTEIALDWLYPHAHEQGVTMPPQASVMESCRRYRVYTKVA